MAQRDDDREEAGEPRDLRHVEDEREPRRRAYRNQCREGRIEEETGDGEPEAAGNQAHRPRDREQNAEGRGHALAALEEQPDRRDVADDNGAGGDHRHVGAEALGDDHSHGALAAIEQQGERRCRLVAGAKNIGGPDIARADAPQVAELEEARHDQPHGERADQIGNDPAGVERPRKGDVAERIGHRRQGRMIMRPKKLRLSMIS